MSKYAEFRATVRLSTHACCVWTHAAGELAGRRA